MTKSAKKSLFFTRRRRLVGVLFFAFLPVVYLAGPKFFSAGVENYEKKNQNNTDLPVPVETEVKSIHVSTPPSVKGIYMTSCVAGTPILRQGLAEFIETTELNSVIIDIKDYTGTLSFKPSPGDLLHTWENARCGARDMREFIKELHEKKIYVIGRITVFQDPHMAARRPDLAVQKATDKSTWKDFKGLSFTDQ